MYVGYVCVYVRMSERAYIYVYVCMQYAFKYELYHSEIIEGDELNNYKLRPYKRLVQ